MAAPHHIKTIAEYHRFTSLPKPGHPLISVIRFEDVKYQSGVYPGSVMHEFYSIAIKKNVREKMKYGQQDLDFDAGVMHFMSPKQVLTIQPASSNEFIHTGLLVLIHPDFLWSTPLAKKIRQYEYFSYQVNEALHLSEKEEVLVADIIQKIEHEYNTHIDKYSQDVIVAQIELLLTYSERFYQRQFITRKKANHEILDQLNVLLSACFQGERTGNEGIPTVQYVADHLNLSPNYLSRLLKTLTGQSTQQFIHDKLIDLAKEQLSTTGLHVSEIAYQLGFEHPTSFSKFFKSKTKLSPLAFRASFN
jgi:AraC-like DNA-binding protein